jgi:Phage integrase, N-terminal SAM-like domain
LRIRKDFLIDGKLVRKQVSEPLAKVSDHYRRKSDLNELVEQKLSGIRAADKCPKSCEDFVDYVEETYFPFVESKMKPSTVAGYRSYWKHHIKPRVGEYALRDFTVGIVSKLLKDISGMHRLNPQH